MNKCKYYSASKKDDLGYCSAAQDTCFCCGDKIKCNYYESIRQEGQVEARLEEEKPKKCPLFTPYSWDMSGRDGNCTWSDPYTDEYEPCGGGSCSVNCGGDQQHCTNPGIRDHYANPQPVKKEDTVEDRCDEDKYVKTEENSLKTANTLIYSEEIKSPIESIMTVTKYVPCHSFYDVINYIFKCDDYDTMKLINFMAKSRLKYLKEKKD